MTRRNIKGATCVACGDPVGFNMRALCGDDGCAQQYAKYSRARRLLRVNGINIEDHDIQPCAFMFTRDVSAKQLMVDAGLLTREHKPRAARQGAQGKRRQAQACSAQEAIEAAQGSEVGTQADDPR
jgi:hypothetical protein